LNCPFDVLPERFRRLAVQYDNDAVAFALVEHLWRAYHALPGSTASSLIDLNPHFFPVPAPYRDRRLSQISNRLSAIDNQVNL
jgi:hypothetical protein